MKESLNIERCLLVGNPNCGKSSLFNHLTGLKQKTGNFQGVTVEKLSGFVEKNSSKVEIIDLPGSFSLGGNSEDKLVLTRFLMNRNTDDKIIFVMDALLMERSLQFFFQIADLGIPMILVLTMKDLLNKKHIQIDINKLEKELGMEICLVNSKNGEGVDNLKDKLFDSAHFHNPGRIWKWDKKRESFLEQVLKKIKTDNIESVRFVLSNILKELSGESLQTDLPGLKIISRESSDYIKKSLEKSGLKFTYQDELIARSSKIKNIIAKTISGNNSQKQKTFPALDKVLLHPVYGVIAFLTFMAIIFQGCSPGRKFQWR